MASPKLVQLKLGFYLGKENLTGARLSHCFGSLRASSGGLEDLTVEVIAAIE